MSWAKLLLLQAGTWPLLLWHLVPRFTEYLFDRGDILLRLWDRNGLDGAANALKACVEQCIDQVPILPKDFPVMALVEGYSKTKYGFPTGIANLDELVAHELKEMPDITKAMIDRAFCIGPTSWQGIVNWQMEKGALLRESHRIGDRFENRVENGLALLRKALPFVLNGTGDVDMVLYWADLPPDIQAGHTNRDRRCHPFHPILLYQKQVRDNYRHAIAFPDPAFVNWAKGRQKVLNSTRGLPYSSRKEKLLFRGNIKGYRSALDVDFLTRGHRDLFDIISVDVHDTYGRMSREEQCNFKYLLHMPGFWGTISTRLRWLLACGSVVLVPRHDWYEFFYPLLEPWRHYVPVGNVRQRRGHELPCVLGCLRTHAAAAQKIAEAGRRFVEEVLTEDVAERYIAKLFLAYSQRMRYHPGSYPGRNATGCRCPDDEA